MKPLGEPLVKKNVFYHPSNLLRSEASQTSFSDLCGAEGTKKEKEQPDWRKYRLPFGNVDEWTSSDL